MNVAETLGSLTFFLRVECVLGGVCYCQSTLKFWSLGLSVRQDKSVVEQSPGHWFAVSTTKAPPEFPGPVFAMLGLRLNYRAS
jgi:hypothetical protein